MTKKGLQKIQDICAEGHGVVYVIFHIYLKGFLKRCIQLKHLHIHTDLSDNNYSCL